MDIKINAVHMCIFKCNDKGILGYVCISSIS